MDPRIGTLIKENGKTVYYAFVNGYDQPHTEGTLAEIEIALGTLQNKLQPHLMRTHRKRLERFRTKPKERN